MSTPYVRVSGDDVAGAGRGPADRRTRGVDINAVCRSPRRRCRPHSCRCQVALDQAGRIDVNAVVRVSGDDVGGAGRGPADRRTAAIDLNPVVVGIRRPGGIDPEPTADHTVALARCRDVNAVRSKTRDRQVLDARPRGAAAERQAVRTGSRRDARDLDQRCPGEPGLGSSPRCRPDS